MALGIFIITSLLFFLIGYTLYAKNDFGSGTLFNIAGLIPSYCIVCHYAKTYCSFDIFNILINYITGGFFIVAIILTAKAFRDNSRYKKQEERRRAEERKQPLIINISIVSTPKEEQ